MKVPDKANQYQYKDFYGDDCHWLTVQSAMRVVSQINKDIGMEAAFIYFYKKTTEVLGYTETCACNSKRGYSISQTAYNLRLKRLLN